MTKRKRIFLISGLAALLAGPHAASTASPHPHNGHPKKGARQSAALSYNPNCAIKVLWEQPSRAHDYLHINGEIKNTGKVALRLDVKANFLDSHGQSVSSTEGLVKLDPLLPGQTSSYDVICTDNPAYTNYRTTFTTSGSSPVHTVR